MAVRIDDVRGLTAGLPRSYEAFVRAPDKVPRRTHRVSGLLAGRDADGLCLSERGARSCAQDVPAKFLRPKPSDMRYQWLVVRLEAIDKDELGELVFDAWRMVVPKKLAALSDDELRQLGVA